MKFQPIIPFEPIKTTKFPSGKNWIAQVKWDGVRILTYFDGSEVRLYNRKLHERTLQFPELNNIKQYCNASSVILDGEMIALENGKPSFRRVMRRDAVRQSQKVSEAQKQTSVIYMIFDILFHDGQWITEYPLIKRQEILNSIITSNENIQLVENFPEPEALFTVITNKELEGIVCKDVNSTYTIKGKDNRWQKIKNYQDVIAVVGGVTFRGNIVNALLVGLYDDIGHLWYIGHVGTGKFTNEDWRNITNTVQKLAQAKNPFCNLREKVKDTVWLTPTLTAKIKYIEWTPGSVLRQPSVQGFMNVSPEECKFEKR